VARAQTQSTHRWDRLLRTARAPVALGRARGTQQRHPPLLGCPEAGQASSKHWSSKTRLANPPC